MASSERVVRHRLVAILAADVAGYSRLMSLDDGATVLALDVAREVACPVAGGHSIDDPEPKYGMAVTGLVHPKKVLTNAGGRAGDVLILTKPIGTGIATTAIKRGLASAALVKRVTAQMSQLNLKAGEVFASRRFTVNALTDVTGFGLLGHLLEVARGAKKQAVLFLEQVPLMEGIAALAEQGVIPGGTRTNFEHVAGSVQFPHGLPEAIKLVLADAQTNGGLLACVPERDAKKAMRALQKAGVEAWVIGGLQKGPPGIVVA